MVKDY